MSLSSVKKGSPLNEKELTCETSYIREKQSKGLIHSPGPACPDRQMSSPRSVDGIPGVFVSSQSFGCRQWEAFTERMFQTRIDRSFPKCSKSEECGYWLPSKFPPTDQRDWLAVGRELVAQGWTLLDAEKQDCVAPIGVT